MAAPSTEGILIAHAEHSVTINRAAEQVFDFLADGTNNPRWRPTVLDIERAGGAEGVGAVWRQGLRGPGGRRVAGDYRVTVSERPSRLAFEVVAGPARPTGEYVITPAGPGRTTVSFTLDLRPRGLMRLMAPVIARQVRQEVMSLDKLAAALEG